MGTQGVCGRDEEIGVGFQQWSVAGSQACKEDRVRSVASSHAILGPGAVVGEILASLRPLGDGEGLLRVHYKIALGKSTASVPPFVAGSFNLRSGPTCERRP